MDKITFEELPSFVEKMAGEIQDIKNILTKKVPKENTSDEKYKVKAAAKYCGMSEPTFRTYIYKRKVAGTKFGKAWLFLKSDLDKFIRDHRRPTADELKNDAVENLTN